MNTPTRLALYGAGLVVLFIAGAVTAAAVVPQRTVAAWNRPAAEHGAAGHDGAARSTAATVRGLSLEQDGYLLRDVHAPAHVGTAGDLTFQITGADGAPLTRSGTSHDKQLHLIVVRAAGTPFRHVHPTMSADGVWSLPWIWDAAGTYRVFADFVPDTGGRPDITLTSTVEVTGDYLPQPATATSTTASVDGFDVTISGDLQAGSTSTLTVEVTRDGQPVTTLEPYLGAFGHLVALRAGDLAYLHVHPEGDEPAAGDLSGPRITFMTQAPTPGRYLLYLDFQVQGQVHTATFVLDAAGTTATTTPGDGGHAETPAPATNQHTDH